jgi:hypothetical protein
MMKLLNYCVLNVNLMNKISPEILPHNNLKCVFGQNASGFCRFNIKFGIAIIGSLTWVGDSGSSPE